jgi:alpha-1,3-rhamnosyl/mannosyltransferase
VLFFGTLEPRKNVGVLLDAYEKASRSGRRLPKLVLAGGAAPDAADWLARIMRPPLQESVEHIGYVAQDGRERLYAGARALVLPSLDEGFGLPVLEAMSAGVPVIVSNRGSLPEVVAGGGTLLPPDDAEAWASTIERVGADQEWALEQGASALERAKAFTWHDSAVRLHQAYLDAVARRNAR